MKKTQSVIGYIIILLGCIVIGLLALTAKNNGYSFSLANGTDWDFMSKLGTFLAGTVVPIWTLASVFFLIQTIKVQQQQLLDMQNETEDLHSRELLFKLIDSIDLSEIKKVEETIIIETQRVYEIFAAQNIDSFIDMMDKMQQTLPLAEKMKYYKTPLSELNVEAIKNSYDKNDTTNLGNRMTVINGLNSEISKFKLIITLFEKLHRDREKYIEYLKVRLGFIGLLGFFLLIFNNVFESWDMLQYFTIGDFLKAINSTGKTDPTNSSDNITIKISK